MVQYKVTNIEYDITFEDVADMIFEYLEDCTKAEIEKAASDKIAYVKRGLPKEMVVTVDSPADIRDAVSKEAKFRVSSCRFIKIN